MPMSETELEAEYDRLTTLIQSVTTTPKPSYTVGKTSYRWTEYLRELREQRDAIAAALRALPYQGEASVDFPDE